MSVRDGCVLLSIALGFSFGFSFSFASLGTIDVLRVLLSYLVIIPLDRAVQPHVALWAMNRAIRWFIFLPFRGTRLLPF